MRLVYGLLFGTALTAYAQQNLPPSFQTVRAADSYRRAVAVTDEKYEGALSTHCPTIDLQMGTSSAHIDSPLQTDAHGNIVNGSWTETTPGVACGKRRLYNAFVVIKDGKPGVYPLLPGHSAAGPVLQHDAMTYAAVGSNAPKGCPVDVVDTELMHGRPSSPRTPWDERWTTNACGKRAFVTMHFLPDSTGTTIHVSPRETLSE